MQTNLVNARFCVSDDTTTTAATTLVVVVVDEVNDVISVPHTPTFTKVLQVLHGVIAAEHLLQQNAHPNIASIKRNIRSNAVR